MMGSSLLGITITGHTSMISPSWMGDAVKTPRPRLSDEAMYNEATLCISGLECSQKGLEVHVVIGLAIDQYHRGLYIVVSKTIFHEHLPHQ